MEKRNYVRPITECHTINSTSFIAASNLVVDGGAPDDTTVSTLIDGCVKFSGYLASNADVINFLKNKTNNTACFKIQRWEKDDPLKEDKCSSNLFIEGNYVQITYDEGKNDFIFNFNSGCSSDDGVGRH